MRRYLKPLVVIAFIAMLATPAIVRRLGSLDSAIGVVDSTGDPRTRYGFRLTEAARRALAVISVVASSTSLRTS